MPPALPWLIAQASLRQITGVDIAGGLVGFFGSSVFVLLFVAADFDAGDIR